MASEQNEEAEQPEPETPGANAGSDKKGKKTGRLWGFLREAGIILLILLAVSAYQSRDMLGSGEPPPPLQVQTLDGESMTLADFKGDAIQLHFWATWCGICRQEFGTLNDLHASGSHRLLAVALVTSDAEVAKVKALAAKKGLEYPIAIGGPEVARDWKINAFPSNYYLDEEGAVVMRDRGYSVGTMMKLKLWWAGR